MIREIIVFTPIYVALFWAVVFLSNTFAANKARFWLGIFMFVVAVLYACHAGYFLGYADFYLSVDSLYLLAGLSVFPLYYLYVRLLTCDVDLKIRYLVHVLPALVLGISLFVLSQKASTAERQLYFNDVLIGNKRPANDAPEMVRMMALVFFSSRIVFGLQVIGYLAGGYFLARKYDHRIANFYSNTEGKQLIWVKLLTISFLLTSIASSVVNILGRGLFLHNDLLLAIPSVLFSSLFFIIGLQGNKQDYTIKTLVADESEDQLPVKEFENPKNDELKEALIQVLETDKIYLSSELRITELCRRLSTNRTYLSNLINNEFELSFNDLINLYRVQHAMCLIETDKSNDLSLADIAIASGFGSVSSFNRAFKKVSGVTAGQYRNTADSSAEEVFSS